MAGVPWLLLLGIGLSNIYWPPLLQMVPLPFGIYDNENRQSGIVFIFKWFQNNFSSSLHPRIYQSIISLIFIISFRDPGGRLRPSSVAWLPNQATQVVVAYDDDTNPSFQVWDDWLPTCIFIYILLTCIFIYILPTCMNSRLAWLFKPFRCGIWEILHTHSKWVLLSFRQALTSSPFSILLNDFQFDGFLFFRSFLGIRGASLIFNFLISIQLWWWELSEWHHHIESVNRWNCRLQLSSGKDNRIVCWALDDSGGAPSIYSELTTPEWHDSVRWSPCLPGLIASSSHVEGILVESIQERRNITTKHIPRWHKVS